jgi:hypothetical protein
MAARGRWFRTWCVGLPTARRRPSCACWRFAPWVARGRRRRAMRCSISRRGGARCSAARSSRPSLPCSSRRCVRSRPVGPISPWRGACSRAPPRHPTRISARRRPHRRPPLIRRSLMSELADFRTAPGRALATMTLCRGPSARERAIDAAFQELQICRRTLPTRSSPSWATRSCSGACRFAISAPGLVAAPGAGGDSALEFADDVSR